MAKASIHEWIQTHDKYHYRKMNNLCLTIKWNEFQIDVVFYNS